MRFKETGNLAFNQGLLMCSICKRWEGDFKENNDSIFECKYNKDSKGIYSGLVKNKLFNYKCKYYKRDEQHLKYNFDSKNSKTFTNNKIVEKRYIKGKYTHITNDRK